MPAPRRRNIRGHLPWEDRPAIDWKPDTPEWMDWASCAEIGGDAWFPEPSANAREAKAICAACPVLAECLQYAMDDPSLTGIWGGLTQTQRQELRRDITNPSITELEVAA